MTVSVWCVAFFCHPKQHFVACPCLCSPSAADSYQMWTLKHAADPSVSKFGELCYNTILPNVDTPVSMFPADLSVSIIGELCYNTILPNVDTGMTLLADLPVRQCFLAAGVHNWKKCCHSISPKCVSPKCGHSCMPPVHPCPCLGNYVIIQCPKCGHSCMPPDQRLCIFILSDRSSTWGAQIRLCSQKKKSRFFFYFCDPLLWQVPLGPQGAIHWRHSIRLPCSFSLSPLSQLAGQPHRHCPRHPTPTNHSNRIGTSRALSHF